MRSRVPVTPSLKTHAHNNEICIYAWAIRRSFSWLPRNFFKLLYSTHVTSGLEFGGISAFPSTTVGSIKPKRAFGVVTHLLQKLWSFVFEAHNYAPGEIICVQQIVLGELGWELLAEFPPRGLNRTKSHAFALKRLESTETLLIYRLSKRWTKLATRCRDLWKMRMTATSSNQ